MGLGLVVVDFDLKFILNVWGFVDEVESLELVFGD